MSLVAPNEIRLAATRALAHIGGKEASERLRALLLETTTDGRMMHSIAMAVKDLDDPGLIDTVVTQIKNEKLSWQIRWPLTITLENFHQHALSALNSIVADSRIDGRIRVGVATTIGNWGDKSVIPLLVDAIVKEVVPHNWETNEGNTVGSSWFRIASTLKNLGDTTVASHLIERVEKAIENGEDLKNVMGVIFALSVYKPDGLASRLIDIAHRQFKEETTKNPTRFVSYDHIHPRIISWFAGKAQVPQITQIYKEEVSSFSDRRTYPYNLTYYYQLATSLGEHADDIETLKVLLNSLSAANSTDSFLGTTFIEGAVHRAAYDVSQRAKVRVTKNKQIV